MNTPAMTPAEWIQVASIVLSAAATTTIAIFAWLQWKVTQRIAALNEILASETRRYAEVTETELRILQEQREKDSKAWLFFDVGAEGTKFCVHCENAGKPTLFVTYAKIYSIESRLPGFSVTQRIDKPMRSGERYSVDLGPKMLESIKRSVFMGRSYTHEEVRTLAYGAQCRLVIEFYDDTTPRVVHRFFPLHLEQGKWRAGLPEPEF